MQRRLWTWHGSWYKAEVGRSYAFLSPTEEAARKGAASSVPASLREAAP
jgi:hypothetical protein